MVAASSDGRFSRLPGVAAAFEMRAMAEEDVGAVVEIERRAYDFPWSAGIFNDCIRVAYHCRVVERAGTIVGYAVMATAAGEAHVLNLCVDPGARRRGLGRALLEHLVEEAAAAGARTMLLEVRPSNAAAIALYRQAGFSPIGTRRNYYPDREGREDALVLSRRI